MSEQKEGNGRFHGELIIVLADEDRSHTCGEGKGSPIVTLILTIGFVFYLTIKDML